MDVNLKARFGKRFRVDYEESYYAERGQGAKADDPWLQILLCQHGRIYLHGGELLGASTQKHGAVATTLARLSCYHHDSAWRRRDQRLLPRGRLQQSCSRHDALDLLGLKHGPLSRR
jgi:hypothetical protein